MIAGTYSTPLNQAKANGHVETVEALLENEFSEPNLASPDVANSKVQVLDRVASLVLATQLHGQTPVIWGLKFGQVEVLKSLISKGGVYSNRDIHSLSDFECCFLDGQASKLNQFSEGKWHQEQ